MAGCIRNASFKKYSPKRAAGAKTKNSTPSHHHHHKINHSFLTLLLLLLLGLGSKLLFDRRILSSSITISHNTCTLLLFFVCFFLFLISIFLRTRGPSSTASQKISRNTCSSSRRIRSRISPLPPMLSRVMNMKK
jgi:hypothetical protein